MNVVYFKKESQDLWTVEVESTNLAPRKRNGEEKDAEKYLKIGAAKAE